MENQAEEEKNPNVHTDLINTFCEITSSSTEEALFFLESHNFHLDAAVSTFFETAAAAPDNPHTLPPPQSRSPSPSRTPSPSSSPSRSLSPSPPPSLGSHPNNYNLRSRQPMASSATNKRPSGSRSGAIRTLSDLNRPSRDGSGSDSDEPQEYYTGGEKSGMLVQDPSNVNHVDAIFTHARQKGAVEGPLDHLHPSSSSRSFTGTGRLLSGETVESIRKSKRRKELEPADGKTSGNVGLMRKEENYPIPERRQRRVSFHGVGRTSGSTNSSTSTEPTLTTTPLTAAPPTSMGLVVDDTFPSTSVQLRLADGTRMVSRFNHHHTIRDIRAFIDASRPSGARTYQLQAMGFPPKQLTDLDQSIEEAGLANSVVIQKL